VSGAPSFLQISTGGAAPITVGNYYWNAAFNVLGYGLPSAGPLNDLQEATFISAYLNTLGYSTSVLGNVVTITETAYGTLANPSGISCVGSCGFATIAEVVSPQPSD